MYHFSSILLNNKLMFSISCMYLFYFSGKLFVLFDESLIFIFVFFWHSRVGIIFGFGFVVWIPDHFDHLKFTYSYLSANICITIIPYFWHENQGHGKKATENNGQRNKSKTSVLLRCRYHNHWCSYQTCNDHIINWHSHVPWIVYLS